MPFFRGRVSKSAARQSLNRRIFAASALCCKNCGFFVAAPVSHQTLRLLQEKIRKTHNQQVNSEALGQALSHQLASDPTLAQQSLHLQTETPLPARRDSMCSFCPFIPGRELRHGLWAPVRPLVGEGTQRLLIREPMGITFSRLINRQRCNGGKAFVGRSCA